MLRSSFFAFLLCLLPVTAFAATVTSVGSGDWNDPTIWDSGVIPVTGDINTVDHFITVPNGVDTPGTIVVGATGTLTYLGASSTDAVFAASGSGGITNINYGAVLTLDTTTSPAMTLSTGATVNVFGRIVMSAASESSQDLEMIQVNSGATLDTQGRQLSGSGTVTGITITSQTTVDDLIVVVDTAPPTGTTHVFVNGGNLHGMIWPITWSGTTVTLDGALLQGYHLNNVAVLADTAVDSVSVIDIGDTPSETASIGSTILIDDGVEVGIIHAVFNESTTNDTAFFIDRTVDTSGWASAEDYILTWGVSKGTRFNWLQMAEVWGGNDIPTTDNTVGGNPATGKDECRMIDIDGTLESDYTEFRWLGGVSRWGIELSTVATTFNSCLWYQPAGTYNVETNSGGAVTAVNSCAYYQTLGPDDGNNGHWFRGNSDDSVDLQVSNSIAVGTLDDFVAMFGEGDYLLQDNVHIDWGSGNFIDADETGTTDVLSYRNKMYGLGETPFQFDGNNHTFSLWSEDDFATRAGNSTGRNTVDTHETDTNNGLGFIVVDGTVTACTITNATVEWSLSQSMKLQADAISDTVYVFNSVFKNSGNWNEPAVAGGLATNGPGSELVTSIAVQGIAGLPYVIEGCVFLNPFRRGPDMPVMWPNAGVASKGIHVRGTASGVVLDIRRCTFADPQTALELARETNNYADKNGWIVSDTNTIWAAGGISYCYFKETNVAWLLDSNSSDRAYPLHHNLVTQAQTGDGGHYFYRFNDAASPIVFRFNTVIPTGTQTQFTSNWGNAAAGQSLFGNVFLSVGTGPAGEPIRMPTAGAGAATDLDYNYFAWDQNDIIQVEGTDYTVTEMETTFTGWDNNGEAATHNGNGWADVIESFVAGSPLYNATTPSVIIDFVAGGTDADGTVWDAGWRPLLTKGNYQLQLPSQGP